MPIPCLLVVSKESLLNIALKNLINDSDKGLVIIESKAQKHEDLIREINAVTAYVILIEKNSSFAGDESLTKLLMTYPKLLLIIVNEDDNWLQVYRREDILMTSSVDLIDFIVSS